MSARAVQSKLPPQRNVIRGLKYKLLGLPMPQHEPRRYVPPAVWEETDTLQYLKQTRVLAQTAIGLLVRSTDLNAQLPSRPSVRSALRPPTDLDGLMSAPFEESLQPLTAYDYGAQSTSRISNYLTYMLRPGNPLELTPELYNRAIGFFLATHDVHMAQLLLHEMKQRRAGPDTATQNLFLASQARRIASYPYPLEQLGHPLLMTISLLRRMGALGVRANVETWNLVLQCMPFGFGKSFLVEEMDRRGIALSKASQRVCLETILSERDEIGHREGTSSRIYESVVGSLDLDDPMVARLLIDRLLLQKQPNNANVLRAWQLLRRSAPSDTSVETLNVFMKRFAERKHLDWQLGILGHFATTPWSPETWEFIITAASLMFYDCPERYVVIGTVLKQAEREGAVLTSRARVCARRALRDAAARGSELQDVGISGWHTLKANLRWDVAMQPHDAAYLSCIGFSTQAGPVLKKCAANLDMSRYEPTRFSS